MEYARSIYGICMEYVWSMQEICMEYARICMEYAWNMHGICMEYACNMHGICMQYAWNIMEYEWNMNGICMEYRGTSRNSIQSPQERQSIPKAPRSCPRGITKASRSPATRASIKSYKSAPGLPEPRISPRGLPEACRNCGFENQIVLGKQASKDLKSIRR